MKKLIKVLVILAIGVVLGYVYHNDIDTKLKDVFGTSVVEKGKDVVEKGIEKSVDKTKKVAENFKTE